MQRLRDWLSRESRPNRFTVAMGKLIRQAREERGMSQTELAEQIYRSRPAISEMETGKMEPDATTLAYLAGALEKPIMYFFPDFAHIITGDVSSPEALELLNIFNQLDPQLQRAALRQVRALHEIDDSD